MNPWKLIQVSWRDDLDDDERLVVKLALCALVVTLTAILLVGCASVPSTGSVSQPPVTPPAIPSEPAPPPTHNLACVVFDGAQPLAGATCAVGEISGLTNGDGYFLLVGVAAASVTLDVTRDGYVAAHVPVVNDHDQDVKVALQPTLPPAPTRDEITNVCLSFQGLTVHTSYGDEPWFEASLPWHDRLEDRQAIYAAKHASKNAWCPNGDTHALLFVPWGAPLYDESGQFYTADKFPALDWTHGNSRIDPKFVALFVELRQNGFIPIVIACGDGSDPTNYQCAMAETPLLLDALQHAGPRDLRLDAGYLPGFDGVFYGWGKNDAETRFQILSWPKLIRSSCPTCVVGIEHGTGKIPIGEGPNDWIPGGDMNTWYDFVLSEFDDDRFDDSVWQIAARTLGPAYRRPSDQPAWDDPGSPFPVGNPTFYLQWPGPRGPIRACAFEFGTYGWVRFQYPASHVSDVQRNYFINRGYTCGG